MKIIFFADAYTNQCFRQRNAYGNYSPAGSNKAISLAEAIGQAYGESVVLVSKGLSNNQNSLFESSLIQRISPILVYVALPALKLKGLRDLYAFKNSLLILFKNIKKIELCIFYNITVCNLLLGIVAKIFNKKIWLEYEDSATVTRSGGGGLKKFWGQLLELNFRILIDRTIACNSVLLERMGTKGLVVPGIVRRMRGDFTKHSYKCNYLFYSGGLDKSKGILEFAAFFAKTSSKFFDKLVICGHGPEGAIRKLQRLDPGRIVFKGLVSEDELLRLMANAKMCVNPHGVDIHYGGSYPFKMVEYLSYNGCVASTQCGHPAFLAEYIFRMPEKLIELDESWLERAYSYAESCNREDVTTIVSNRYNIKGVSNQIKDFL